jgi:hypothetical protein
MATEYSHKELNIISLSRKEAVEIVTLLIAQLANEALPGNASGAIPTVNIVDRGVVKYRLALCLEPTKTD